MCSITLNNRRNSANTLINFGWSWRQFIMVVQTVIGNYHDSSLNLLTLGVLQFLQWTVEETRVIFQPVEIPKYDKSSFG